MGFWENGEGTDALRPTGWLLWLWKLSPRMRRLVQSVWDEGYDIGTAVARHDGRYYGEPMPTLIDWTRGANYGAKMRALR